MTKNNELSSKDKIDVQNKEKSLKTNQKAASKKKDLANALRKNLSRRKGL